jgi:hypothetical protein
MTLEPLKARGADSLIVTKVRPAALWGGAGVVTKIVE